MTSKWIEEIIEIINASSEEQYLFQTLDKVDKLLRKAMLSTDDENLADEIRKEISGNPS